MMVRRCQVPKADGRFIIGNVLEKNGSIIIKPWLEICFLNGKQHIDFEIVTASAGDEKFLDYETFVTKQNENKVLNKIWSEINRLYRV